MKMKVAIAQPHILPGNIDANLQALLPLAQKALETNAGTLLLPMEAMTGSDLGGLQNRQDFRRDAANARIFLEKSCSNKMQIIYSDDYNFCGFSLQPRFMGISPLEKNITIHGGGSAAYDTKGNPVARARFFKEDFLLLDFDSEEITMKGKIEPAFSTEIEAIYHSLIFAIREFCALNHIKHIIVGLSGGIDSAVATALYTLALGPDKVLTLSLPGAYNSALTQKLAENLAQNLKTWHLTIPINAGVEQLTKLLQDYNLPLSELNLENIQARERGSRILAAVAASQEGIVSVNSNKAELSVGYSTFYGDLAGALAPLGDLWKHQVYELGRYINEQVFHRSVIPEAVFQIRPSAELSESQTVGKGGDPLYYPYHDYLFQAFVEGKSLLKIAQWYRDGKLEENLGCKQEMCRILFKNDPTQFIQDLEHWYNAFHGLAVAKRIQAPPIIVVSSHPFGAAEPQIGPYYSKDYLNLREQLTK